jgi:hypothetical protein
MRQWEYMYIYWNNPGISDDDGIVFNINGKRLNAPISNLHGYLNQLGSEGWELTGNDNYTLYFKRPLVGSAQPVHQSRGTARLSQRLPWLDMGTAGLLTGIATDLRNMHREVVALIVFGSVARHEERPLSQERPSDVNLLALVDTGAGGNPVPPGLAVALNHTIAERERTYPAPSLGVQAILTPVSLADRDKLFLANVARDGVLLWARGLLPDALAPVAARGAVFSPDEILE